MPARKPQPSRAPARSIPAVLASVIAHAGAGAALVILAAPVEPPVPEPVAITVELLSDPATENEEPQEVRTGRPDSAVPAEAAPETNDPQAPQETAEAETPVTPEELPESIPIPQPRPAERKAGKTAPDKAKAETADTPEDNSGADIVPDTGTEPAHAGTALAYAVSPDVRRDVRSEQRWLGRLSAHLARRKRYPRPAQARGQEGTVLVRFVVAADGTILTPELVGPSGVPELDGEVLDLLRRASPAPRPPPDANPFVTVPISFTLER